MLNLYDTFYTAFERKYDELLNQSVSCRGYGTLFKVSRFDTSEVIMMPHKVIIEQSLTCEYGYLILG